MIPEQWEVIVVAAIVLVGLESWRRWLRDRAARWVSVVVLLCEIEMIIGVAIAQYRLHRALDALVSESPADKTTMLARHLSSAMNANAIGAFGALAAFLLLLIGTVLLRRRDSEAPLPSAKVR